MRRFITNHVILALTVVLSGCTNIFLQPDRSLHLDPDRVGAKWTLERFKSADGTELTGLWFPSAMPSTKGVVLQFHGNGENMTSHFLFVYWLALEGYDVFAFDYRGYGGSGGSKSLAGSVADGAAALAYARAKTPGLPLVVIGQSLGGALALASLDRDGGEGVRALVLDSTFSSYTRVARLKLAPHWQTWALQWLPYVLVSDRFSPAKLIARRKPVPLLMVHAPGDPVVPYSEGRRLYERAPGPKEFWDVPGTGHTEAFGLQGAEFRPRLLKFLDAALSSAPASAIIAK
ncbi:MAG TPA: alpha/beta fold hydrolase [Elusimicrobiota bacterium]|nr:alpha/beta fold hydrolase [Elusimicrobiota bacterium]